jgi:hypothetical protein
MEVSSYHLVLQQVFASVLDLIVWSKYSRSISETIFRRSSQGIPLLVGCRGWEIQHDVSNIRVILTHRKMAKPSAAKS